MKPLQIQYRATDTLQPHERLARTHSKKQIKQIARSIKRFGFVTAVLVTSEGKIIAGHAKVAAALLVGMKEVPTVCIDHLNDAERRAYIIADNKLALQSGWDKELLALELQDLAIVGFDLEDTGFSLAEVDLLLEAEKDASPSSNRDAPEDELLSFAQFEREVTGERIRDKIAASNAKGMWMGSVVPLGYQVKERKLRINVTEAAKVRMIFERYAAVGSTTVVTDELQRRGIVSKERRLTNGTIYGGKPFTRGALAHLLKNRVYIGEVTHRDQVYPGEHPPIIQPELWDRVQALLAENRRERRTTGRATEPSLLTGLLRDGLGRPMTPTHATKGSRRYRYYVSRVEPAEDQHRAWRLPAPSLEQLVITTLSQLLGEGEALTSRLAHPSGETTELIQRRSSEMAKRFASSPSSSMLSELHLQVHVLDDRITVEVDARALLAMMLGPDAQWVSAELNDSSPLTAVAVAQLKRRGPELRLVFRPDDQSGPAQIDPKLVELMVRAQKARRQLLSGKERIARAELPHLTRLARLTYLAPDIVQIIMEGRQPANLSATQLLRTLDMPVCWAAQRAMVGVS